jgi:hypothetical protein
MITERQYRNALAVVKRYQDEQEQIKLSKINCENITLDTSIDDLYYAGVITPRLYNKLRKLGITLHDLTYITLHEFSLGYGVGDRMITDFVELMNMSGHKVL